MKKKWQKVKLYLRQYCHITKKLELQGHFVDYGSGSGPGFFYRIRIRFFYRIRILVTLKDRMRIHNTFLLYKVAEVGSSSRDGDSVDGEGGGGEGGEEGGGGGGVRLRGRPALKKHRPGGDVIASRLRPGYLIHC